MKCDEAHRKISAYMDGELDEKSSSTLSAHIDRCFSCRADLMELQSLDHMLRRLPKAEASESFCRNVLARVKASDAGVSNAGSGFPSLLKFIEEVLEGLVFPRSQLTGTLDEFADFPPLSVACVYFRIFGQSVRG